MNDNPITFDWANQTELHPVGLAAVMVLGLVMLLVPRRYAIVPFLIMACFVASRQRIVVLTLDFNLLRVLVLFGWMRIFLRAETIGFVWKSLDTVLLLWAISSTAAYTLLYGTQEALINRLGFMFDAAGMYFLFRVLIRNWDDVFAIMHAVIIISIPVALAFLFEKQTGRNVFSIFGGVPEFTVIRQGTLRCQGAFAHPILAGCFWASLAPLIAACWWQNGTRRFISLLGLATSLVVVYTCASSTPMAALAVAGLGATMWPLRHWMRFIVLGLALSLVGLHFVMNAPVWHLISRIDLVGGSTGWHRYHLIDQAIRHFEEWWLLGTTSTADWGWGLLDVTNQYVIEGVSGGILTLALFVSTLVVAFISVGRLWRSVRDDRAKAVFGWGLGVSLFVHTIVFLAVSYFGQIVMIWYLLLAVIGSLTPAKAVKTVPVSSPRIATGESPTFAHPSYAVMRRP